MFISYSIFILEVFDKLILILVGYQNIFDALAGMCILLRSLTRWAIVLLVHIVPPTGQAQLNLSEISVPLLTPKQTFKMGKLIA